MRIYDAKYSNEAQKGIEKMEKDEEIELEIERKKEKEKEEKKEKEEQEKNKQKIEKEEEGKKAEEKTKEEEEKEKEEKEKEEKEKKEKEKEEKERREKEEEEERKRKQEKKKMENKIESIFKKISNFEDLKREVYIMKKSYKKTAEDVFLFKKKFNMVNSLGEDIVGEDGKLEFLQNDEDINFRSYFNEKLEEINKKISNAFGEDFFENEESNINNNNNNIPIKSSKKINSKLDDNSNANANTKILNLKEISKRLNHLQSTKVYKNDFDTKNEIINCKIADLDKKLDELISQLFGETDLSSIVNNNNNSNVTSNTNINNKKNVSFTSNIEFYKYVSKSDKELTKVWEEINNLRKSIEDINNILKEKTSFSDLENMKNLILQKIEELVINLNKKNNENSTGINNLVEYFKKLLLLLSKNEDGGGEQHILISKKITGGYSCASCESFLGDLKGDKKYIHWKKMPYPLRERELSNDGFLKIGNGYSRLLQMIDFDKNGKAILNPFSSIDNNNDYNNNRSTIYENNKIREGHEINRERIKSVNMSNKNLREKNKTIDKDNLGLSNIGYIKKLPSIRYNGSVDNLEKNSETQNMSSVENNSTSVIFSSPKNIKTNIQKFNVSK